VLDGGLTRDGAGSLRVTVSSAIMLPAN